MKILKEYFSDLISLFYPDLCRACSKSLFKNEDWLCSKCLLDIPRSDYWKDQKNPVNQLFWGKTKIEFASAFMLFTKASPYRKLIHNLKYNNDQKSGFQLGYLYGKEIFKDSEYSTIDYIIPVPLHPKKEKKRGYNQSDCIAEGLSKSMEVDYLTKTLIRTVNTSTQTRKHKDERWNNVSGVFDIKDVGLIKEKHILLVDDVITTGATIEHCALCLIEKANCEVSVACLARA